MPNTKKNTHTHIEMGEIRYELGHDYMRVGLFSEILHVGK